MGMVGGLIILVVVLGTACVAGFVLRARQGRFRADSGQAAAADDVLTAADLGTRLGERATLVQFSTEYCTYCGPTRELLAEVASERDGVMFVEIDAAQRMDLTRRLRVMATPTILVLGPGGTIENRASGRPRRPDLLAAIGAVLGVGSDSTAAVE
jgi:thiol-disulfide isomerase/thioredoxin